jgi:hypothetical protein
MEKDPIFESCLKLNKIASEIEIDAVLQHKIREISAIIFENYKNLLNKINRRLDQVLELAEKNQRRCKMKT